MIAYADDWNKILELHSFHLPIFESLFYTGSMTTSDPLDFDAHLAVLDAWVETQKQIAVLEGRATELLNDRWSLMEADIREAPRHRDSIWRSMVAEFSAAARIPKTTVEHAFTDAHSLHEDFPTVAQSLRDGVIRAAHVREIVRAASVVRAAILDGTVDAETLALFESAALVVAERETPARTRPLVAEIAAALARQTVVDQHRRAKDERRISIRSVGDGLALLQAVLPEHLAVAILDRLSGMARELRRHPERRDPVFELTEPHPDDIDMVDGPDEGVYDDRYPDDDVLPPDPLYDRTSPSIIRVAGDERTTDQVRADIFTDLLLASDPSAAHGTGLDNITANVQVTVAATTLADLDTAPAMLDGHGPLHPDIARAIAGRQTGWTKLFLDERGHVHKTETYTPTEPMRRFLRARDQHCRFPGCRMPVARSEVDHQHDWALGGTTSTDNLAHLCPSHHVLKHPDIPSAHRWTARQLPDWSVEWTSPHGRTYSDSAPRRVMFVPSDLRMLPDAVGRGGDSKHAPPAQPALAAPF